MKNLRRQMLIVTTHVYRTLLPPWSNIFLYTFAKLQEYFEDKMTQISIVIFLLNLVYKKKIL